MNTPLRFLTDRLEGRRLWITGVTCVLAPELPRMVIDPALLAMAGDWNWWLSDLAGVHAAVAGEIVR
jgi:hypothetical protein